MVIQTDDNSRSVSPPLPLAEGATYETPKRFLDVGGETEYKEEDGNDDSEFIEDVKRFGRQNFGEVAGPYLAPYLYNKRYLDKLFGIGKSGDGKFRIDYSLIEVDDNSNVIVHTTRYRGTNVLWEFLTRKKVNSSLITRNSLKTQAYLGVDKRSLVE